METSDCSILVTGGAGFIGSHLVERLIKEQVHNLVVVDNLFLGKESNLEEARRRFPGLKVYVEDATDYERMRQIIGDEKIRDVFDLATVPLPVSLERPYWASQVIFDMGANLCELCRQGLFQTLIHCSSSEVYGTAQYVPMHEEHPLAPRTPYAASKAAVDLLILSYCCTFGINAAIVRPFNTYGPRQNADAYAGVIPIVIQRVLRGEPPVIYGDGEQTRDFTYVEDTVEGIVAVWKNPRTRGRVVNIGSGCEMSIADLVRIISELMGFSQAPIHAESRPGDVRRHQADVSLARRLLGFEPRVDVQTGLQKTVAWYRELSGLEGKYR